jgi:hypothetical protein
MGQPRQPPARSVRGFGVLVATVATVAVAACSAGVDHVAAAGQRSTPAALATAQPTARAPAPVAGDRIPEYLRTPPPGKHPDPCGVADPWDDIPPSHDQTPVSQPADRVQKAAKTLFPGRFLEVYINDVPRQYGVGVIVYRFTPADESRFFASTCFRRGDVVFVDGPVSPAQFNKWRRDLLMMSRPGICESYEDRRTGTMHVTVQPGHPQVRAAIKKKIPAAHLKLEEGGCPVPL